MYAFTTWDDSPKEIKKKILLFSVIAEEIDLIQTQKSHTGTLTSTTPVNECAMRPK